MYKRGLDLRSIINSIPLNKILIETDSKYLMFKKNQKYGNRNDVSFITYLLFNLSKLKNKNIQTLSKQILKNTFNFFGI